MTPPRIGKFAKLRDAYKGAKSRYAATPTPELRAVRDYLERARAASIMLSKLRHRLDAAGPED